MAARWTGPHMMLRQTFMLVTMAFVLWFCSESHSQAPSAPSTTAFTRTNATGPRGQELARQYCSTCHLFPEPQLLTKREWAHHVLPQMARWLGIEPVDYEGEKDGKLLEEAGIFPSSAILPEPDWFAIWDYYVSN